MTIIQMLYWVDRNVWPLEEIEVWAGTMTYIGRMSESTRKSIVAYLWEIA